MADQDEETGKILERLHSLELRLSKLESALNTADNKHPDKSEAQTQNWDSTLDTNTLNEEEK